MDVVDRPASALPDEVVADLVPIRFAHPIVGGEPRDDARMRGVSRERLDRKPLDLEPLRIGRDVEIDCAEFVPDLASACLALCPQRRQRARKPFSAPRAVEPLRPNRALPTVGVDRGDEARGIGRRLRRDGGSQSEDDESGGARQAENGHWRHARRIRSRYRRASRVRPCNLTVGPHGDRPERTQHGQRSGAVERHGSTRVTARCT